MADQVKDGIVHANGCACEPCRSVRLVVEDLIERLRPVVLRAVRGEIDGLRIEASGRGPDAIKIRLTYEPISMRLVYGFGPEFDGRVEVLVLNESADQLVKTIEEEHQKAVKRG